MGGPQESPDESLDTLGRPREIPWWSLAGPRASCEVPELLCHIYFAKNAVSEGSVAGPKNAQRRRLIGGRTSAGSVIRGSGRPTKLLAETKSYEKTKKLRVRHLTGPRPVGPANFEHFES